jgi:site-specific recombinase XerD
MNEGGDKMATNLLAKTSKVGGRKTGPYAKVKAGSAVVPIYQSKSGDRVRYAVSFYRDGKRLRKMFSTLDEAKKEALFVAQRIQVGMQYVTDLKPHERDSFKAAEAMLQKSGIPLVAAVEDYLRARDLAGTESLSAMASEYGHHFKKVVRRITIPEVVAEMLLHRKQDGASKVYLGQLKTTLNRFGAKFPGEILDVTSQEIDAWLRSLEVAPGTRNSMLRCIKVFFSFARSRNYLPEERNTAADSVRLIKSVSSDYSIFTPKQMETILHAAPPRLVPILAIEAFSGIRVAELGRLDWSAVDLDRRIIELRADQAKTASRRVVPIADNLAAWLTPLKRKGKVVVAKNLYVDMTALVRALKMEWPRNVLRHSFISYRIATVKSADQVALEAGNSPSIIFKHYRELTTEDEGNKWFGILPKEGQWENTFVWDKRTGRATLNGKVIRK